VIFATVVAANPLAAGRRISWWLFAAAICVVSSAPRGMDSEGILHITRYTACFAFLNFIVVFAAGALVQLFPFDRPQTPGAL